MANFTPSALKNGITRFVGSFTGAMNRNPFIEFFKVMMSSNDYIMPDASSLKEGDERPIEAKIMKTVIDETIGSARTCTIGGTYGDSVSSTLNWNTYTLAGRVSLKQHLDNEFAYEESVAKRLEDMRRSILKEIESDVQAWFATNRSTVNDATSYGSFDDATNVFELDAAYAANPGFLNIAEQMLRENHYVDGMYQAIVNGFTMPQLKYQFNQGAGNAANLMFQFDKFDVINGLGYLDANYPNWFGYTFAQGLIGTMSWVPLPYRMASGDMRDNIGLKQSFADPQIPGLMWTLKTKLECEDTTAYNGDDDDEVVKMQLGCTLTHNYALTEDGSTPIFAIGSEGAA